LSGNRSQLRRIQPVILSGGAGMRLWPLSRPDRPKQMIALAGGETMLRATAARVEDRSRFEPPLVVTAAAQGDAVAAELGSDVRMVLEPCRRNTAPAVALAALAMRDPGQLLLIMPSDHLISDVGTFTDAVARASAPAAEGMLVTFGIRPTHAETGFGYILRGEAMGNGLFRARRFVEKPDKETADRFIADGGCEWNAGIFLFTAGAYLSALAAHAPDILEATKAAMAAAQTQGHRIMPHASTFGAVRAESVDRAVMEHAANVVVVPIDAGWSDVGSWEALHAASSKDGAGNSIRGPVDAVSSSGSLIVSEGPRVLAIGVENMAIVATADAVIVVPLARSQQVGEAVARILSENAAGSSEA
jgi:mannose-1-phosphate guanylyltransferase